MLPQLSDPTVARAPSLAGMMIIFKCQRERERERERSTNKMAQERKEHKVEKF